MKKKITSLVAMLFIIASAWAQTSGECGADGDNVMWNYDSKTKTLTITGSGDMADFNSNPPWRFSYSYLKNVSMSDEITRIGNNAFYGFWALDEITLPKSLTSIGNKAFWNCSAIREIILPNSITSIGEKAFSQCYTLKTVIFPTSLTSIGDYAFYRCHPIKALNLPNTLTSIGKNAFDQCYNIDIIISAASTPPTVGEGAFNEVDKSIPVYVPSGSIDDYKQATGWKDFFNVGVGGQCGDNAYWIYENNTLTITGSGDVWDFKNSASPWFSYRNSIENLEINEGITRIGNYAFIYHSKLGNISFPQSLISIGNYAFHECWGLGSINLPESLTTIGNFGFWNCSAVKELILPNSITSIGSNAFAYCYYIGNIKLPESLTTIESNTFEKCYNIKSIILPSTLTTIKSKAFYNCYNLAEIKSLASTPPTLDTNTFELVNRDIPVTVPEGCIKAYAMNKGWRYFTCFSIYCGEEATWMLDDTTLKIMGSGDIWDFDYAENIGANTPWWDSRDVITSIEMADEITGIGDYAFSWLSSLPSIDLSGISGLTFIGMNAFDNCAKLEELSLPASLTQIRDGAFMSCSALKEITSLATKAPNVKGSNAFYNVDKSIPVNIPMGTYISYSTANGWKDFFNLTGDYQCGDNAYWRYDDATKTLTFYGTGDMWNFGDERPWMRYKERITDVVVQEGITGLSDHFIKNAMVVQRVSLPSTLTLIGHSAFFNCVNLVDIELPEGLKSIGAMTFFACRALKELTLPGSIENFGDWLFKECENLSKVVFKDGITTTGKYTFVGCKLLTNVDLPKTLQRIEGFAFQGCGKLVELTIPEQVMSIGMQSFEGCSGLTKITSKASTPPTVLESAFDQVDKSIPVVVPQGTVDAHKAADGWKEFYNISDFGTGLDAINAAEAIKIIGNDIILNEVQQVAIYSVTGAIIYQGYTDRITIDEKGVYIVKIGIGTMKAIIR